MYREQDLRRLFSGKRILLAGYGREGRSTERLVRRLDAGADITVADGDEQIMALTERPFDMIVKSPGVPMRLVRAADMSVVTSQADLFMQVYADRVIGVTGTKGKSTTSSLIAHLLPGSILAGNIGVPLFDIVEQLGEGSLVVAELSCHQLELLRRSPHVALVLNLYQEHLDHYKDYAAYKLAKMQIGLHQTAGDHFFYCTDNEELCVLAESLPLAGERHPYGMASVTADEEALLSCSPLLGEHNRSNVMAACRIASLVQGQPPSALGMRLSTFQGLRHRLERVAGDRRGVVWYNDSISTIPEATVAALRALEPVGEVGTLIVGGYDRGIDYSPLTDYLAAHPVRNVVFVGKAGRRMLEEMGRMGEALPNHVVEDDYAKIVPWCAEHTGRHAICLLSPAAASYDTFKNFEARGDFYVQQIQNLP